MHVLKSLEELIDDELLVDFLEDAGPDDNVEVYMGDDLPVSIKSKTR